MIAKLMATMEHLNHLFSTLLNDTHPRHILIAAGTALTLLSAWTINDQRRWTSLDTGGSPPTWYGYMRMTVLRVARLFSGGRLIDHYPLRSTGSKFLRETIEPRQGPRPQIREWTLPQRHEVLLIDPDVHAKIFSWTEQYATNNAEVLDLRPSAAEGSSAPAVYARQTKNPEAQDRIIGSEIFHAHPEDGSLHVWLSEADAKVVVSRGWGERFPLSALGMVHRGFTFVYAPRTMAECDIVEEIIRAGVEFVAGQKPA